MTSLQHMVVQEFIRKSCSELGQVEQTSGRNLWSCLPTFLVHQHFSAVGRNSRTGPSGRVDPTGEMGEVQGTGEEFNSRRQDVARCVPGPGTCHQRPSEPPKAGHTDSRMYERPCRVLAMRFPEVCKTPLSMMFLWDIKTYKDLY